jgi:peptidoglycan DL-endopeptidase CwlO
LSDRDPARHRAPLRAVTPLTGVSDAVTGRLAIVGRSSAAFAVSTGLVATSGLPAQALEASSPVSSAQSSSGNAFALTPLGLSGSPFASSVKLEGSTAISAPAAARVTFATSAFRAVPAAARHTPVPTSAAAGARSGAVVGRPGAAVRGSAVLAIAARYVGIRYLYGGTTPSGFDCSGFTGYVYRQLGVSLPRTANQQMLATQQVSRSEAKLGDLVFFVSGGRAYHNGIYAGGNMMYDSPRAGKALQKREIWSAAVVFTRVTG